MNKESKIPTSSGRTRLERRNLAKKHMDRLHKPKTHKSKKDYKRKEKHPKTAIELAWEQAIGRKHSDEE